jgi:secreted PhoX family phosphatase
MHHDDEAPTNFSGNPYFGDVLHAAVSRRSLLQGGVGAAGMALLGSVAFLAPGTAQAARKLTLGFDAVAKNLLDAVTVPPGYSARALFRTGDPIAAGVAAYLNDGTDADMHQRAGDQHDAIAYYGLGGNNQWAPGNSSRGLLAMNFENILPSYLHPAGATSPRPQAQVDKEIAAHGVGIVEIRKQGGAFEVVPDSPMNRRITAATPMELRGPVAGSALAITKYDPSGRATRGTVNNCANGVTPWGTYLTCEENWNGYFRRASTDAANRSAAENKSLSRYGVGAGAGGANAWASLAGDAYERWNTTKLGASADGSDDYRNVVNTFGWVVGSIRSIRRPRRASGRRWAAWATRAPGSGRSSRASRWCSTWATTRASSTSTSSCRRAATIRNGVDSPPATITSTKARCTSRASTTTAPATGSSSRTAATA